MFKATALLFFGGDFIFTLYCQTNIFATLAIRAVQTEEKSVR